MRGNNFFSDFSGPKLPLLILEIGRFHDFRDNSSKSCQGITVTQKIALEVMSPNSIQAGNIHKPCGHGGGRGLPN